MKSFKKYLKEKTLAVPDTTAEVKFSGVMGFGAVSGDSPSPNLVQKGDNKKPNLSVVITVQRGIKNGSIVKDEETGSLKFKSLSGEILNSQHAAIARTEIDLFSKGMKAGGDLGRVQSGAATIAEFIKTGRLGMEFGSAGEGTLVPINRVPPPLRSGDDDGRQPEGKPLTDEGDVVEYPDGTILVYDYDKEYWFEPRPEEKPDDAVEQEGSDDSGLTDEEGKKWKEYQQYLDWFTDTILDILNGDPFSRPPAEDDMQDFIEHHEHWFHHNGRPPTDDRSPIPGGTITMPSTNPDGTMGDPGGYKPKRTPPKKPKGWDPDRFRQWEEEQKKKKGTDDGRR